MPLTTMDIGSTMKCPHCGKFMVQISDQDIYEAIEDNAKINLQLFSEKKIPYYMKKGSKITIKDHMLKFNKSDFHK